MCTDRLFYYKKDNRSKALDLFDGEVIKSVNKDRYEYHYEVLPHAFFGDVSKAKVIFLAKNPSFEEYDDLHDDWIYLENFSNKHPNIDFDLNNNYKEYEDDLKNVNFFENFKMNCNRNFYTSWKWWNMNVISGAKCGGNIKISSKEVAFVNICGYRSVRYKKLDYSKSINKNNWFGSSIEKNTLVEKIKSDDVYVIIVWGRKEWSKFLNESNNVNFFMDNKKGKFIVLNETRDRDKNNEKICRQHINSIYSILKNKQEYKDNKIYDDEEIKILEDFFSLDSK